MCVGLTTASWLGCDIYFVISLHDSTGEARMSNMGLGARYMVIDGVCPDEVPAHIAALPVAHWNSGRMSLEHNRALQGACAAHVRAWRAILHAVMPMAFFGG